MNLQPVIVVLGLSVAVMLAGWLIQQRRRNPALADLLWAACISIAALFYGLVAGGAMLPRLLVALMGGLWGFRLFMHLLQRMLAEPADSRQRALDERLGRNPMSMLAFFVGKGASATAFSVPLYVAASNPLDQATPWTILAAAIYLIGLTGQSYADVQLTQFREQPKHQSRTCRSGLWRYSRHPNYFYALVHWFSYAVLAIGVPWPSWSLTLLAPLLAAVESALRIRTIETEAQRARGDDYRDYQRTTSAFVPWLPAGWPKDATAANAWYTPPPPSRASSVSRTRGTPLPGARITPAPSARLPGTLTGPTTPRPEKPLGQRVEAPVTPDPPARLPAGDVDDD
jgi:steroid 5-alpha reductase family enzyme